uniref:Putative receptor-type adenylate cyclase GRESAG 4 n=1 Tax=Trypanosoma congolense (strain IL3000) TaxID=1068625 RepID=G0UYX9_TRYCI|nr:putative receptor-type adenylate cyclase GRESAG 4 [Trypanosoma congolense IL3000]
MRYYAKRCVTPFYHGAVWLLLAPLAFQLFLTTEAKKSGAVLEEEEGRTSGELFTRRTEKHIYTIVDRIILITVCLSLSAIFAGLTIGILCMDTLTLSVIASSGKEPDRTHASKILPLRREGHVTLCTLVVSNMLMNVIVVQQLGDFMDLLCKFGYVPAFCQDSTGAPSLALFIISTLVILIFTEILPMSICKSKYSLSIAAAGCFLVRVARVIVYPVAMPLGLLLDRLVPHGAGQIYDRNELRKLMILHCEAHGERSGLATSELKLLIAAMDFQERRVGEIMKPRERVITVNVDEVITSVFIEALWTSGRSRVPVVDGTGKFCGILIVKDLLSMPLPTGDGELITVGEFVGGKSRIALTVHKDTPLPTVLKLFQHAQTQMLFVTDADNDILKKEEGMNMSIVLSRCAEYSDTNVVGIVTLEDVLETLIKGEIYDEYDRYEIVAHDYPVVGGNDVPPSLHDIPPPLPQPEQIPRANFYSYYVRRGQQTNLTEAQVWAAAYYLSRAVSSFYLWHPGYVKMLLDECGVQQFTGPFVHPEAGAHASPSGSMGSTDVPTPFPARGDAQTLYDPTPPMGRTRRHNSSLVDIGLHAGDERAVLYRSGVVSSMFTLVLGGRVEVLVKSCGFSLRRRSFEWLGEDALRLPHYVPDFDAVVLYPTCLYRIPRELYNKYNYYNNQYNRAFDNALSLGRSHDGARSRWTTSLAVSFFEERGGSEEMSPMKVEGKGVEFEPQDSVYGTFEGHRLFEKECEEMGLLNEGR